MEAVLLEIKESKGSYVMFLQIVKRNHWTHWRIFPWIYNNHADLY